MNNVSIRTFQKVDTATTAQIFFDAVRIGTSKHYTPSQREAWAPVVPDLENWHAKLSSQTVYVAEVDNTVIGFMSLTVDGCIDLAFVSPSYMGKGIAQMLYQSIVKEAQSQNMTKLHVHASYLARGFFERNRWAIMKRQSNQRKGIRLINFLMEKDI